MVKKEIKIKVEKAKENILLIDEKKRANLKKALLGGAVIGAGVIGLSGAANADIILRSGGTERCLSEIATSNIMTEGTGSSSTVRTSNLNDACGSYSGVLSGGNNITSESYSTVSGGRYNTASGKCSIVSGGTGNCASNNYSTVSGGYHNLASACLSTVSGGMCNRAISLYSTIGGGRGNQVNGLCAGILGGYNNCAGHSNSFIIGSNLQSKAACSTIVNSLYVKSLEGSGTRDVQVSSTGLLMPLSDERLKNICGTYTEGYCVINKLDPIRYSWKDSAIDPTNHVDIGFSAQNLQKAIPEAVSENNAGYLGITDRPIIAALVNSIKELKEEHDTKSKSQEAKIKELENRIKALE
jgi:hypothetical protein